MDIGNLTLNDIERIKKLNTTDTTHPYTVGANYLVRTVTNYYTGKLVAVYNQELVFSDTAWIPDTGRFADALNTGDFNEIEPYRDGEVIVGRVALIDASIIEFDLPRVQK